MNNVEQKIFNINPGYLPKFKKILERYSQFVGVSEDECYVRGKFFSNVYEIYTFAFFLGLRKDIPYDLSTDDKLNTFWEIKNWKCIDIRDHLIACSIAQSEVDLIELQNQDDQEIDKSIRLIRGIIERYANGGLRYIESQIENDPDSAALDNFFIKMLS